MLTQQQLDTIASYCQIMGVKYYDVQLELVDHIADMIEHLQQTNPVLDFDEALRMAIQQFAPCEFLKISKNKEQQLRVRFKRLLRKEFWAYFSFPKIMLTLCLMVAVISLNHYFKVTQIKHFTSYFFVFIALFNSLLIKLTPAKSRIIKPILPLLVNKVLNIRDEFMMGVPIKGCVFLVIIGDILESILEKNGSVGFWEIKADFLLYPFPLLIVFYLAWRKVYVDQTILMHKQYALAFDN